MNAVVTQHGGHRVRKRMGLPKKTVQRLADQALAEGAEHSAFAGSFKRYLDGVFLSHNNAGNMRVFRGFLFLFAGETLVTCWPVPQKYRKAKPATCS